MEQLTKPHELLKKPLLLLLIPFVYLLLLVISKWHLSFNLDTLFFVIGGIIGMYFIDVAEHVFSLYPSPFRTTLFLIGLCITGFYTVTSTHEMMAIGIVLTLCLTLFLYQVSEWEVRKNLDSWYSMFSGNVPITTQRWGLIAYGIVFFFLSVLFMVG